MENNSQNSKKTKKPLWLAIFIISTVLFVMCVLYIVFYVTSCVNETEYKELANNIAPTLTDDAKPTVEVEKRAKNPIDFEKLKKINKDIVAWIRIKDTNIDYPVLRAKKDDVSYYLHRDYKGDYLFAGSIYMEYCNQPDFSDRDTILYGHNMQTGTMFADLHKFESKSFFNKHKYMYIYTPDSIKKYEIYSAYEYDDRHIDNSFEHFRKNSMFKEYINYSLNPTSAIVSNVRKGSKVTISDKLVTLSTCTNNRPQNRYLVQGVLIDNERTN